MDTAFAFVIFSTENEADSADLAGPHIIGGMEVKVKRVVSPKVRSSVFLLVTHTYSNEHLYLCTVGLCDLTIKDREGFERVGDLQEQTDPFIVHRAPFITIFSRL